MKLHSSPASPNCVFSADQVVSRGGFRAVQLEIAAVYWHFYMIHWSIVNKKKILMSATHLFSHLLSHLSSSCRPYPRLLPLSCMTSSSSWSGCIRRRRGRWKRSGETWRRRWTLSTGRRWQLRRSPYLSPSRKTRTRKSKPIPPVCHSLTLFFFPQQEASFSSSSPFF